MTEKKNFTQVFSVSKSRYYEWLSRNLRIESGFGIPSCLEFVAAMAVSRIIFRRGIEIVVLIVDDAPFANDL